MSEIIKVFVGLLFTIGTIGAIGTFVLYHATMGESRRERLKKWAPLGAVSVAILTIAAVID